MGYTPLDSRLPFSTVNVRGGPIVLALWALILSQKDQDGFTTMTAEGAHTTWLGSMMPLPLETVEAAWDFLLQVDKKSENPDHEGRRLIRGEGGRWKVVSHEKYQEMHSGATYRAKAAARQQRFRDRQQPPQADGQEATPQETPSPAAVAVVERPVPPKPRGNPTVAACCDIWNERYGKKSAVGGKIAGAISPLLSEYTHEEITNALRRYLAETNHPNPDPNNFREHFGDWLPGGKGAGRTPIKAVVRDVTEENRQALREIQKEREGK